MRHYVLIFFGIVSIFTLCFQCSDDKLKIKNNSSKDILVYYSQKRDIKNEDLEYYYSHTAEIPKNSISPFFAKNNKWNNIFEESQNGIVTFYVFDSKLFQNRSIKEGQLLLKNNKLYLEKYELNKSELKRMNWLITYPPVSPHL